MSDKIDKQKEEEEKLKSGDYRWIVKIVKSIDPNEDPREAIIYYLTHGTLNASRWDRTWID